MQRIYGYAFFTKEELDQHLHRLEEAKRRDHRKLGRELDLFSIADETGAGLILWHPKGGFIRKQIEDYWRDAAPRGRLRHRLLAAHREARPVEHQRAHRVLQGEHVLADRHRGRRVPAEADELPVPHHDLQVAGCAATASCRCATRSSGTVYRFERSGVLHGLLRVRGFTQDDAHIFCRPDQLEAEILRVLDFVDRRSCKAFGFDRYDIYLSTQAREGERDRRAVGDGDGGAQEGARDARAAVRAWTRARASSTGPKIDIKIKDSLDRAWQCSTIQVDFHNPNRFELEYIGEDGKAHQPVMVHRALLGQPRALLRRAHRALRGRVPALARAGAGRGDPGDREAPGLRARGRRRAARARACASTSTTATRSWATGSARPRCRRSPTCWWWGTRKSRRRRVSVRHRHAGDLGRHGRRGVRRARSRASRRSARSARRRGSVRARRCLIDSKTVRINDRIRAKEVRVIDEDGAQLGIMPPAQALMLAEEKGLDLVEIAATATPPVCRIMNSGKFFYQQAKRDAEARKHQRHIQIKEVKFRPKIDEHDFAVQAAERRALPARRQQGEVARDLPRPRDRPQRDRPRDPEPAGRGARRRRAGRVAAAPGRHRRWCRSWRPRRKSCRPSRRRRKKATARSGETKKAAGRRRPRRSRPRRRREERVRT